MLWWEQGERQADCAAGGMTQMAWSKRDAQWFTGSPLNFSSSDAALSPLHLTDSPGDPHAPLLYKSMEELRPLRPMPTACSPPPSHSGPSGSSSRSTCWTRFVCVCSNINLCDCTSYHNYAIWLNTVEPMKWEHKKGLFLREWREMFWRLSCQRESAVKSGTEAEAVKDQVG